MEMSDIFWIILMQVCIVGLFIPPHSENKIPRRMKMKCLGCNGTGSQRVIVPVFGHNGPEICWVCEGTGDLPDDNNGPVNITQTRRKLMFDDGNTDRTG